MTKIYGASDDLIEIEGDVNDEHGEYNFSGTISCSDGTKVKVSYDEDGNWKFNKIEYGSKFKALIVAVGDDNKHTEPLAIDCSSYSDVLILDDGIEWVKVGRKTYKK